MVERPGRRPEESGYEAELPIADTSTGLSRTQALRIEISAYEDYALVDSTSLDVQILDDPFELQNPLPDRALLRRIASLSGGQVLPDGPRQWLLPAADGSIHVLAANGTLVDRFNYGVRLVFRFR